MPCSEKKRQANRENARKSTGPKSRDGKAKVALNALKHGLRSEMVVLPGEDPGAFDAMVADWMSDWQPPTDARRVLVELAVAHAWRLRRCLKVERDHLIERGRLAALVQDEDARARARDEVARLETEPESALETLLAEREGAAVVLGLWKRLADAAALPNAWSDMDLHHARLLNLLGRTDEADAVVLGGPVYASWRLIEWNAPEPTEFADDCPDDEDHAAALAGELSGFIAGKVARLERYIAETFPAREQRAAQMALRGALDDSPEGRALLRYEGQHGRDFRATLNQLIRLTQTDADVVEDEEGSDGEPPQIVEAIEVEPEPSPAPNKATEVEPETPDRAAEAPEQPAEATPAPNKPTEAESFQRAKASFLSRRGAPQPPMSQPNP
jgi:hypothetical protein